MTLETTSPADWSYYDRNGLTPLINVSGTMTGLGASIADESIRQATADMMAYFVNMHQLQARASRTIAALTGAEAGCMTASASAGITLSIAGAMTGLSPARVEALPKDPGDKNEVVIQLGHMCGYGAPVAQAIELTGATVKPIGQSTHVMDFQLEAALNERTAAALYVVSHHVVHYGQMPLPRFAGICAARNVPVIVDAASEYDLRGFLQAGADLVVYSGHKFLGGPTSGIIAGKRDLVRAAYLQNMGIGRGMKIGKESIAGAIAALEAWQNRDHAGIRQRERAALDLWVDAITGFDGVDPQIVADPTGNPLDRLQVNINPDRLGANAASVARALAEDDPAIIVRNHEVELGYFQLDPCNLKPGQADLVAHALKQVFAKANSIQALPSDADAARNGGADNYLRWLADQEQHP